MTEWLNESFGSIKAGSLRFIKNQRYLSIFTFISEMHGQLIQVTATFHCIGFLSRVLVFKAKLRKLKSEWRGRQRRLSASLHLKVA